MHPVVIKFMRMAPIAMDTTDTKLKLGVRLNFASTRQSGLGFEVQVVSSRLSENPKHMTVRSRRQGIRILGSLHGVPIPGDFTKTAYREHRNLPRALHIVKFDGNQSFKLRWVQFLGFDAQKGTPSRGA
ncbi:MAG: hypothetical protein LR015_04595 [Verrucomicrobia bacterium]|nr:hypothetical protein [Verrucomicrobiota bacterium]